MFFFIHILYDEDTYNIRKVYDMNIRIDNHETHHACEYCIVVRFERSNLLLCRMYHFNKKAMSRMSSFL